jgi:hypothetical protein
MKKIVVSREPVGKIAIIKPNQMTPELLNRLEQFRLPPVEYSSEAHRDLELKYDREYNSRSIYIICFAQGSTDFIAVLRIIIKKFAAEKLPIEYARVAAITDNTGKVPATMTIGECFAIDAGSDALPVCEIGGLRVAEIDPAKGIDSRLRYHALIAIMNTCISQVCRRRFRAVFLTCVGTQHMERLYHDKVQFNEAAQISYAGSTRLWKALWRRPFNAEKICPPRTKRPMDAYVAHEDVKAHIDMRLPHAA